MTKETTIEDVIETNLKDMPFEERACKFEEEVKPLSEKWGVILWAGLESNSVMIAAVPQLKDTFQDAVPAPDKS